MVCICISTPNFTQTNQACLLNVVRGHRYYTTAPPWRLRSRLKTFSAALVLCLNLGIDPPDVVKTTPCAKLECWVDPESLPPNKALEGIGRSGSERFLQDMESWKRSANHVLPAGVIVG